MHILIRQSCALDIEGVRAAIGDDLADFGSSSPMREHLFVFSIILVSGIPRLIASWTPSAASGRAESLWYHL